MRDQHMSKPSHSVPLPITTPQVPSRRKSELIIFAALLAFLPIPLIIPFFIMALLPMSLFIVAFFFAILPGGPPASYAVFPGLCILVLAPIWYGLAKWLCWLIYLARDRSTRIKLVTAFVLVLSVLSLFPIYTPGLDPPRPAVNIIGIFRSVIPVGQ